MKDILPEESGLWQYIEDTAKSFFARYAYRQIRTPILEELSLFTRSIGEATDIVQKEMYAFKDKGGRNVAMRPEGTAPVVRAYLENNLSMQETLTKLYYIGPMFRSEKPQSGRQRQFHQIGAEAIGSSSPYVDAELISMIKGYFDLIGLADYKIKINTLGCPKDKARIKKELTKFLSKQTNLLCKDCKVRYKKNILRVFDCKEEGCKALMRTAPKMIDFICEECGAHFDKVKAALDSLGTKYTVDPYIVRGLDYYTSTAFEVTHPKLGSQDAIGAGGRYDCLVREMGGQKTPACGFALGEDRIIMALGDAKKEPRGLDIYFAVIGEKAYQEAYLMCNRLRESGISADIDYQARSLKAQMRQANKKNSRHVAILGEDELVKGSIIMRDMSDARQREVKLETFVDEAKKLINGKQ
jgi:histidyl-tRNA synthetase